MILQSLISWDKHGGSKPGNLIIKHAKRKSELICLRLHAIRAFFGDSAVMHPVTFTSGVPQWIRVTVTDIHVPPRKILVDACSPKTKTRLGPPHTHTHTSPSPPPLYMHESKAWFMEGITGYRMQESFNLNTVILFVVRMWLKLHLLSLKIQYRGWPGREPVYSERFCPRKKKKKESQISSKLQTLKRLIRNRVKNVITMDPSNKSKALHFVKTLLGYSHPVN